MPIVFVPPRFSTKKGRLANHIPVAMQEADVALCAAMKAVAMAARRETRKYPPQPSKGSPAATGATMAGLYIVSPLPNGGQETDYAVQVQQAVALGGQHSASQLLPPMRLPERSLGHYAAILAAPFYYDIGVHFGYFRYAPQPFLAWGTADAQETMNQELPKVAMRVRGACRLSSGK